MSVVAEEPQLDSNPETEEHGPDVSILTDKVPEHLRAPRALAGMVLVLGIVFFYASTRPIWHTDVWGHLSYGRYMWETGSLPATEPLLPFAKGMPFVNSPWLSQLIGLAVVKTPRFQLAGLQGLFAVAITACGAMLSYRSWRESKNAWFSLMSLVTFLTVAWTPLSVLRPQLAGLVCFVFLLTRLSGQSNRKSDWFVIPLVFALWANLHASFLVGLGLLACFCLGRAIDVIGRTGTLRMVLSDAKVRRMFLLTELSAVAVLVNPYTIRLYLEALQFSGQENLQDLTEWHPLTLRDEQGQIFAGAALLLAVLYRLSPRRVRSWEVLTLVGLGLATMWSTRMIVWWSPIVALLAARHSYSVWRAWSKSPVVSLPALRAGKWSFVSIGLTWIFFMLSPIGIAVMHGKHSPTRLSVSKFTPLFAVEYLTEHPPEGPIFNTYEWGDYLQWAGPANLQLFVNSHAHLVPRDVWSSYMQVIEQRNGWEETLDKYGINTVVIDTANREALVKKLREDDRWKSPAVERDGQVIFTRKKPILSSPAKHNDTTKPAADVIEAPAEPQPANKTEGHS